MAASFLLTEQLVESRANLGVHLRLHEKSRGYVETATPEDKDAEEAFAIA